ncbi:MAG: PAS domain S-box protein [Nannocystaceae bacterium]|nr:PAS domain S-box protein [Nannocystaceae bacterium]
MDADTRVTQILSLLVEMAVGESGSALVPSDANDQLDKVVVELESLRLRSQADDEHADIYKQLFAETLAETIEGIVRKGVGEIDELARTKEELLATNAALNRRERHFSTLFENCPVGAVVADLQGQFIQWNQAFLDVLGFAEEEFQGKTIRSITHPDDLADTRQWLQSLIQGDETSVRMQKRYLRRDGTTLTALTTISKIEDEGGNTLLLAMLNDISELEASRRELARSNEDFQSFAHAASHDLKAPLRHMRTFAANVLKSEGHKLSKEGQDRLQRVCNGADRLTAMTDSLLEFAKVDAKPRESKQIDLHAIARHVVADLNGVVAETGAQVVIETLPTVTGDAGQMYQVLLNLVGNALKYHRPNVPPEIAIRSRTVTETRPGSNDGHELMQILVEDNGIGFDEVHLDRIFKPFQRLVTRREFEGSGIGLGTVKKIVERHGGSITAKSTLGVGSTFIVTLAREPSPS